MARPGMYQFAVKLHSSKPLTSYIVSYNSYTPREHRLAGLCLPMRPIGLLALILHWPFCQFGPIWGIGINDANAARYRVFEPRHITR